MLSPLRNLGTWSLSGLERRSVHPELVRLANSLNQELLTQDDGSCGTGSRLNCEHPQRGTWLF